MCFCTTRSWVLGATILLAFSVPHLLMLIPVYVLVRQGWVGARSSQTLRYLGGIYVETMGNICACTHVQAERPGQPNRIWMLWPAKVLFRYGKSDARSRQSFSILGTTMASKSLWFWVVDAQKLWPLHVFLQN